MFCRECRVGAGRGRAARAGAGTEVSGSAERDPEKFTPTPKGSTTCAAT